MSTAELPAHDAKAERDRRRKRRERTASRAPEPKDIVSGAGQPLDLSVRRDLEEQLGHDLSRIRLHTDRAAGALTDMLGADAVAVGQDIFFREGAFRPGTTDGRRLLAHELLHTVQNPDGLGTLRAGRDLGAVSLPQQAIEREAESAAQELADPSRASGPSAATAEPAAEVEPGQATPGWLRYATVDADRHRGEMLDPATLTDRLANGVLRSLRGDPQDASGRVRLQLARMSPELQDGVLDRLELLMLSNEFDRVLELTDEAETPPLAFVPSETPGELPDLAEQREDDRAAAAEQAEGDRQFEVRRADDTRTEQRDAKDRGEQQDQQQSRAAGDAAEERREGAARDAQEAQRAQSGERTEREQQETEDEQADQRQAADEQGQQDAAGQQDDTEQQEQERKEQREREEQDPEQANEPGSPKHQRQDAEKQPAVGSKQQNVDPKAGAQPGPVRPEKVDERAEQPDSPLSEHGLHEKDDDYATEGDPREEELPIGVEAGAERDVSPQDDAAGAPSATAEPTLQPEDYLPGTDLDVSAVPTADQLQPGSPEPTAPTFPTPPPTKAEQVEKERENDESDAETEDGPDAEAKAPGEERGPVEGEARQPENGPVTEAGDRTAKDLQTEQPVEQEVGPDPAATDHEDKAAEDETKTADEEKAEGQQAGEDTGAQADGEKDGATGDGAEDADAKDAQAEQDDRRDRDDAEAKARPAALQDVASAPLAAGGSGSPGSVAGPPAGSHTEQTPAEDRHPSPATRRTAEPVGSERDAAGPKSTVPKDSGPGGAPSGVVGGTEPAGPTTAAGPGAAPSAAQAAVSPAEEQSGNTAGKLGAPAPEGAKPGADASLEKDGGGCAPPAPAAEQDGGGSSCGGGGGGKAKEEKKQPPPDVSAQDPKTALSTVSKLPPDQAQAALPGVDGAATNKVKQEQQRLDANPPTRERPSGAPRTQSAPPAPAPPEAAVTGQVERVQPPDQGDKQQAKGSEKAQGAQATDNAPQPAVSAIGDTKLSPEDAQNVEAAADQVPTSDPALRNKTVGPAPKIRLEGASDPKRTDDQAQKLKDKQTKLQETGRADSMKPMGEDKIYPDAPPEQLHGKVQTKARTAQRSAPGKPPKDGIGTVAQQERGAEIQAGAGQARAGVATSEKQQQQGEQQAKQQKQAEIDRSVADNAAKQTSERGKAAQDAERQREQWRTEQDKKVEDADKKTETEHDGKNKEITKARDDKDKEVAGRKDTDNKSIDDERKKSEEEAKKKKEEKKPSGGFFGWIADKVKSFFSALLDAVTKIFDAARKAVNGIIDKFKEFANKAIDAVRDFAINAINVLADALIAIGDVLLAAFPGLRDKFRNAINGLRDKAINAVNQLADGLKKAVNALLDALAAGLNALLDVLEAGIKAAIKIYETVIVGALKFVEAAVAAFGQFAELIADIAPDPGGWLSKLGSAAKTGVTDYLWGAIKTAVKQWFDDKVQSVIGLGKTIIDVLVKGCMSLKQIGKMAWDAIIAALPMMIIALVIEKLVSLVVPAAGAILTIIQGLMAAWGTISRVLAAFGKFWAFLKAVKGGAAACLFAEAVAAGVVALLEFIANFLLQRLGRALKPVGKRLQALAQKILKGLKKAGKGARKAAGGAVNRARGAARKAAQAAARPARPAKPKGPKVPSRPGASSEHGPAKPKGPATSQDRPTSKTPNREKEHRRDEEQARQERDKNDPRKQPEQRPESRDTDGSGDRDRTPDKSRDQEKPPGKRNKPKETEAPKRTKPRKPKSPVGRALSKVKGAVKGALKKIRNAGRTLGKKLRKSKVGQALKKTGHKLRDFFKKRKNQHKDQHKSRNEQKKKQNEERKKKENSKEAKEARLQKIVSRIKPKTTGLLRRGIKQIPMKATLQGMRLWYRLTQLDIEGAKSFLIEAALNPRMGVTDGVREAVRVELKGVDPKIRADLEDIIQVEEFDDWLLFVDGEPPTVALTKFKRILEGIVTEYKTHTKDDPVEKVGRISEKKVQAALKSLPPKGSSDEQDKTWKKSSGIPDDAAQALLRGREASARQEEMKAPGKPLAPGTDPTPDAPLHEAHVYFNNPSWSKIQYLKKSLGLIKWNIEDDPEKFPIRWPSPNPEELRDTAVQGSYKDAIYKTSYADFPIRKDTKQHENDDIKERKKTLDDLMKRKHPDHRREIQFNGPDSIFNMSLLNGNVNTSSGSQLQSEVDQVSDWRRLKFIIHYWWEGAKKK